MKLLLQRRPSGIDSTLGDLYIDGKFFCYTLEDVVRETPGTPVKEWKVDNKTAIPAGTYQLELVDSKRFGPDTISLKDVPGFASIRMHSGNTAADTEGCLLVGNGYVAGGILQMSRDALARLKETVSPALKTTAQVWITVKTAQIPYAPAGARV